MVSPNPGPIDRLTDASRLKSTICIPDRAEYILESPNDLPGTNITLHQMFIIVGGVCMGLSVVITLINLCSHFIWRANLREQKQVMRIMLLPVMFTVFSWCSIVIYGLGNYLDPIPKLYEVYVVACFHHLMISVLCPDPDHIKDFFIQAERRNRSGKKTLHANGSYRWYRVKSMFVHQCLFIIAIFTIIEEVLVYNECKSNTTNTVASAIITVLTVVFTILAVVSLVRTYFRFKTNYQGTRTLRKFWAVKGFVFLYLIQSVIIAILKATGAAQPTKYMTKTDIEYGLFAFLLCCEGFIFSIFSVWSLGVHNYRPSRLNANAKALGTRSGPDAGVGRYLITFLFPKEVFVGFALALQTFFQLFLGRKRYDYTAGTGVGWKDRQGSGAYVPLTSGGNHKEDHEEDTGYRGA